MDKQKKNKVIPNIHNVKSSMGIYVLILVFTFILYGNTISHDYALDDTIVITKNEYVKNGLSGIGKLLSKDSFEGYFGEQVKYVVGGRYRPLSLVTYAIEYEFFGQNPHVSHLINVLLYALSGIMILIILKHLFYLKFPGKEQKEQPWFLSVPFVAAILFIAHPIHTEAIANIKGRDEILALLLSLTTLHLLLKYIEKQQFWILPASTVVFFLALLSKENAITFVVLIPLSIYFFTSVSWKKIIACTTPIVFAGLIFLIIRFQVLGWFEQKEVIPELMNNPFIEATTTEKYATIFFTLLLYLKLLFFPHPLTYDYYPYHIELTGFGNVWVIIALLIYIGMAIYGIKGLTNKKILSYCIWLYLVPLSVVSNIVFPVGTFMSERFLYISSLGFCIMMAYLVIKKIPGTIKNPNISRTFPYWVLIPVVILYSFKTIDRNHDWKDNYTLFTTDIKTSPNSAKGNTIVGETFYKKAKDIESKSIKENYLKKAIPYLQKALKIHPGYEGAWILLGDAYRDLGDYDNAEKCFKEVVRIKPLSYNGNYKLGALYGKYLGQYEESLKYLEKAYKIEPGNNEVVFALGTIHVFSKINIEKGIQFLHKSIKLEPGNAKSYKNLGGAYFYNKQYQKALKMFLKANELKPNDYAVLTNVGITYKQLGNEQKAQTYLKKASSIKQQNKKMNNHETK